MKVFLFYNISYKNFTTAKPLRIRFDKIDGFIRFYDETRYFAFFESEKYDLIYNRIKYLIGVKSGIICYFSKLYKDQSRFKRFFTSRKRTTFHNFIIFIKLGFNKNENNYFYNIFFEKTLYPLRIT